MNNESFSSALFFSFVGHIALLAFGLINIFFFKDQISQIESAIRVDLVALPDKAQDIAPAAASTLTLPEPLPVTPEPAVAKPELPTKVEEKPAPKVDETAINLDKVKKKQDLALQKLKQQSAIERLEEQLKKEATAQNQKQVKGNVINNGSDIKGLNQIQFDQYYSSVDRHIRQYWSLPPFLKGRELKASVEVKIESTGKVISALIAQSSGNTQFDENAVLTAESASPVPPPPEKFQKLFQTQGFIINFKE